LVIMPMNRSIFSANMYNMTKILDRFKIATWLLRILYE